MNILLRKRVAELCAKNDVSARQVEIALGMPDKTIAHLTANMPRIDKVVAIADYFHVSVDWLLDRESTFSQPEIDLINRFRSLTDDQKNSVMILINGYTAQSPLKKDTEIS